MSPPDATHNVALLTKVVNMKKSPDRKPEDYPNLARLARMTDRALGRLFVWLRFAAWLVAIAFVLALVAGRMME